MTTLSSTHMNQFMVLSNSLSPENLYMDGEATPRQASKRRKTLMSQWRKLEKSVGRKVSEDEIHLLYSRSLYKHDRSYQDKIWKY